MDTSTIMAITESIVREKWNPRIEFAMHGEPSAHPRMVELLRLFRRRLPKRAYMMMTSNGFGFVEDPTWSIDTAMQYLNTLAIEDYRHSSAVKQILVKYLGKYAIGRYPEDKSLNPHRRMSGKRVVVISDISTETKGTHSSLNNHAGCAAPGNTDGHGKKCAKPFRELSVRWDGSVAICCNDWRGEYKCGNVNETGLGEIWRSESMQAARRRLYQGIRDFEPCSRCDAVSYRVGLLPDKRGTMSVRPPMNRDERTIAECLNGRPYTVPVLRPWETPTKKPRS